MIHPVSSAITSAIQQAATQAQTEQTAAATPFAGVFHSMVQETSSLETKANEAVTGLMNGSGVEVHDAMIATQKADMSFELALQVRNKAVAAYQQMMNMQF
ncbi:MAG: flagellar hook-basal body complex protein FliE [Acidobacteriaceae bacterium]|nr:flagellar hook-basal body complex protein FliE [Acidobacteriaceae bacterium]